MNNIKARKSQINYKLHPWKRCVLGFSSMVNLDIHPDKQIALIFYKHKVGMLEIAFNPEGFATWGYSGEDNQSLCGRFSLKGKIPNKVLSLIRSFY